MARCVPAPACTAMRAEASRRWPMRNQASDGICSSLDHRKQNPGSDHDYGNAVDLTHDPADGVDCNVLAEMVKDDPRVKYVIWNRRIYNPRISRTWRSYRGSNPHTQHMHVSIKASARNDTSPWFHHHAPKPQEEDDMFEKEDRERAERIEELLLGMNHQIVAKEGRLYRVTALAEKIAAKLGVK